MSIDAATTELENGTRSTTRTGDNLLLDFARVDAAGYGFMARAAGGRVEVDEDLGIALADAGSPAPFGNVAHILRPVPNDATAELAARLRGFYGGRTGGPFLVFSPWPTGDLGAHGFALGGHPPLMVRPAGGSAPIVPGFRVVEVTTPALAEEFERTIVEAYPAGELQPFGTHARLMPDGLLDPASPWRLFIGYEGERAVATAAAIVGGSVVGVEAVSTRSECRGRGYGAVVTAAAMLAAPDRPSALVASDLGRGVYEGLGYLPILRYTLWIGLR